MLESNVPICRYCRFQQKSMTYMCILICVYIYIYYIHVHVCEKYIFTNKLWCIHMLVCFFVFSYTCTM